MSNRTLGHYLGKRWMAQAGRLYLGGALLGAGALSLAACSGGDTATGGSARPASVAGGKTMGGQQPIKNATVTLYAAGSGGYGQGSALTPTATTDANGAWNISFACPAAGTQIYVVVSGGDAGGGTNSAIALSALLGHCGDSSNPLPTNAVIDEVTTVAAVYALNPFLSADGTQPGTSSGNATGLANAVGTLANLVDLPSGSAVSVSGGTLPSGASGTSPASALNTLADILAACVNSSGASSSQCSTLFSNALSGSTAPTTTLQAALNIARNPGANVANLYALSSTTSPFQPILTAAPGDFTLAMVYTGVKNPAGLAVDSSGAVWIAAGSAASVNGGHGAVYKFNSNGAATAGPLLASGMNGPTQLAFDPSGNLWVGNSGGNSNKGSLSELSAAGSQLSPTNGYTATVNLPSGLAIDQSGNVWVGNGNNTLSKFSNSGGSYTGSTVTIAGDTSGGGETINGIAIDSAGNLWIGLFSAAKLIKQDASGNPATGSPYSGGGLSGIEAVAIDASGNTWAADQTAGNGGVSEFSSAGVAAAGSPYRAGGIVMPGPLSLALDGSGKAYVASYDANGNGNGNLTVLSASGTPLAGSPLAGAYLVGPAGSIAVDRSGNVWVTNSVNASFTELVGLAAPVKTPLLGPAQLP